MSAFKFKFLNFTHVIVTLYGSTPDCTSPAAPQALKAEVADQPHLLEASVFGYDDVYRKLQPFVAKWREIRRRHASAQVRPGWTR